MYLPFQTTKATSRYNVSSFSFIRTIARDRSGQLRSLRSSRRSLLGSYKTSRLVYLQYTVTRVSDNRGNFSATTMSTFSSNFNLLSNYY